MPLVIKVNVNNVNVKVNVNKVNDTVNDIYSIHSHQKRSAAAFGRGTSFVVSFVVAMNRVDVVDLVVDLVDVDLDVDLVDVDLEVDVVEVDECKSNLALAKNEKYSNLD